MKIEHFTVSWEHSCWSLTFDECWINREILFVRSRSNRSGGVRRGRTGSVTRLSWRLTWRTTSPGGEVEEEHRWGTALEISLVCPAVYRLFIVCSMLRIQRSCSNLACLTLQLISVRCTNWTRRRTATRSSGRGEPQLLRQPAGLSTWTPMRGFLVVWHPYH